MDELDKGLQKGVQRSRLTGENEIKNMLYRLHITKDKDKMIRNMCCSYIGIY